MSKQVKAAKIFGVSLNETDVAVLALLADGSPVHKDLSMEDIAQAVGVSSASARRSVARLAGYAFLSVQERFMPNGGQRENQYRVTSNGKKLLKLIEAEDAE